jgi:hypothetical protein
MTDFFLTSSDSPELNEHPRACKVIRRLLRAGVQDSLLVEVNPPLSIDEVAGQGVEVTTVVLAPRHVGVSLLSPTQYPIYVHVAMPLADDIVTVTNDNTRSIMWGDVYATESDARRAHYPPLHAQCDDD